MLLLLLLLLLEVSAHVQTCQSVPMARVEIQAEGKATKGQNLVLRSNWRRWLRRCAAERICEMRCQHVVVVRCSRGVGGVMWAQRSGATRARP